MSTIDFTVEVMRANESFVRERAAKTFAELITLITDGINVLGGLLNATQEERINAYFRSSIEAYLVHILVPTSYAMHATCMMGTLPAAFAQLRTLVEGLVKASAADSLIDEERGFANRLAVLDRYCSQHQLSVGALARLLDTAIGGTQAAAHLWQSLSNTRQGPRKPLGVAGREG